MGRANPYQREKDVVEEYQKKGCPKRQKRRKRKRKSYWSG
jgi:hypothetical protein